MLGLMSIKLKDGTQHDDLARCRNTLIKGKHVVHAPRRQLEVFNVDRGGIPGVENTYLRDFFPSKWGLRA